ncbi:MAG: hypothetical protein JWO32_2550 [Bacteroidetes bacterium]|nr:hypothetical protein [Bacteroidota bacterium]
MTPLIINMENDNWWGASLLGDDFQKKFDDYTKEKVNKRADDADFFLDILIEQEIIKLEKKQVREYFIKWYINNKDFDLQIENGDLAMEDGDLKFVPDFNKGDIVSFVEWFESEKNDFIGYLKDNGVKIDEEKNSAIVNSGNLIINNESTIQNQTINTPLIKKKWEKGAIIGFISLIVAIAVLLFGNNLLSKCSDDKQVASKKHNNHIFDTSVVILNLPYLENVPILDKGIFLKYYFNSLIIGGTNLESTTIRVRAKNGEKLEINKDLDGNLDIDINTEPYIEIKYRNEFYLIEVTGKHYEFHCRLLKLVTPTLL